MAPQGHRAGRPRAPAAAGSHLGLSRGRAASPDSATIDAMSRPSLLAIAALLVVGCATTVAPSTSPSASLATSPTPVATSSQATIPSPSPSATATSRPSAPASCVESVLAKLTPAQVVGQLFMVGLPKD